MTDVRKALERGVEDLPRRAALRVGHEADATRVALGALLVAEVLHGRPLRDGRYGKEEPPGEST